ncbi:hypothetical protein Btru_025285 [Bulinus truncatus]|nr:hypothetical protein Btru_025285 [Bulinus truncatus]
MEQMVRRGGKEVGGGMEFTTIPPVAKPRYEVQTGKRPHIDDGESLISLRPIVTLGPCHRPAALKPFVPNGNLKKGESKSSGSLNVNNDSAVFQMMSTLQFPLDKIIDDRVRQVWYVVLKCAMYELFGAFGLATNVLTLAVLWDMGCHDSSGTTLISLTLSDLVNMLVLLWMGVCYNPFFTYSGVSFDTQSVVYLSGGWLKIYISRVTSWITAFLSVERCLCIAMPLRVKHALTKSRSAYVNAGIFIVIFCMLPPIYATTWLSWQWFPDRNRTLLGLDFSSRRDDVYAAVASVNVVLSYASFFIILACTVALVVTLKKQAEWRTSTSSGLVSSFAKERRVNKMIVLITVLFIVCYFPGTVVLLVMVFIPEFNKGMFYNNLFTVVWAFIHILEAWNSSFNIFVYYRMSSKFRAVLNSKFSLVRKYLCNNDLKKSYHDGVESAIF